MPAKTLNDLPKGRFILCRRCKYEDGDGWEVVIVDKNGKELLDMDHNYLGWIRLNTQVMPWMVDQAHANDGWGPPLYDLAMELATASSGGLRPHFKLVSPDAYEVWKKYFHERQDVEHSPLDKDAPWEHDEAARPELRFVYKKQIDVVKLLEQLTRQWLPEYQQSKEEPEEEIGHGEPDPELDGQIEKILGDKTG